MDSLKQFKYTNVRLKCPSLEGVQSSDGYIKPNTEDVNFSGRKFIMAHNF